MNSEDRAPSAKRRSAADAEPHYTRLSRNMTDLLSELRVAQASVQILFGFLLAVAFTKRFREASTFEKSLHLIAVLLTALSTACLVGPVVWHRMLFGEGLRREVVTAGNRAALIGTTALFGAIAVVIALIVKVTFGPVATAIVAAGIVAMFIAMWFVLPLRLRAAARKRDAN
ncbi:DUF6328 family protein [Hoyosella altamirensis]|uniref:Flp pilus assembly protein TadB n=1 Tax=Hoyosella altamirensis TaxID=616997 RepID=A0A839RHP6_9ACTN|nr:DUF6328 family protein [Hoyosella altamirensis]MBB3036135.1 Flp pilus assembly protein TadB [Hoyosella altamirensis]